MRKKIGILGGTFDPPHLGHLIMAEEVKLALQLQEVWFLPTNVPPHKKDAMTSANHRYHMLNKAIKDNDSFKVNTTEIEREGKSYTFDTISILKEAYPENDLYFIIGADMVEYLPKWYKIKELIELVSFVAVNRPSYSLETTYPVINVHIPMIEISSTAIRHRLASGETVKYLMPDSVYTYIKENRLYEKR